MPSLTTMVFRFLLLSFALCPALGSHLPYVIGGADVTDDTKWPWQGSIEYHEEQLCGCVLIRADWAVTAAHCATYPANTIKLRFGSLTREAGGVETDIIESIVHEDWGVGDGYFPNNIGVIRFAPLTLDSKVNVISLADADNVGNPSCYITGWGVASIGSTEKPTILQEGQVNVYSREECEDAWGPDALFEGDLCFGDADTDACNGDSGSPLVCSVDGSYQLVGVISWGASGCETTHPSVSNSIPYYKAWIEEKINM